MVADRPRALGGARLFPGRGRGRPALLAVPPRRRRRARDRRPQLAHAWLFQLMGSYVELQVTSHFSFLRGSSAPEELFAAAGLLGHTALGMADWSSVAGVVRGWDGQKA